MTTPLKLRPFAFFGLNLADFKKMFDLSTQDIDKKILDYGSAASSFTAQMHASKKQACSCDPCYALSLPDLKVFVAEHLSLALEKMKASPQQYHLANEAAIAQVEKQHQQAIACFFDDFVAPDSATRYCDKPVQQLSFENGEFELALCSHYLFDGDKAHDIVFHQRALDELLRVAHEVRIFPLHDPEGEITPLLGPLMLYLQQKNFSVEVRKVDYHLQKNDKAMLRIWHRECKL